MQFLVIAYDGTDELALERRMTAREDHLKNVNKMISDGSFIHGGAILNEDGKMIGSTLLLEFDSKEDFDNWLKNDPYTTGNVWENVKVEEVRLVKR